MSKFNVGDKVRFIDNDLHEKISKHYPKINTIGVIKLIGVNGDNCLVQWPKGSTSKNDLWWVTYNKIELVKDENMTNEEIWEMLKPKMEKNKLEPMGTCTKWNDCVPEYFYTYSEDDVYNAIAIAYRSGYERAMKGRPFKFGKKKSGHWEPVDHNNLPKEGTKVRYSRECKDYANSDEYICINDTGTIKLEGSWFGVTLDNPHRYKWICFDNAEDCLDMWVEDDE